MSHTTDRAGNSYRNPLRVWPYTWSSLRWFVAAYAVMVAIWSLLGFAVVHWVDGSAVGRREVDLIRWFEDRRTDQLDTIAHIGSIPSDTYVTIGLMVVLVIAFPLVLRRWHDWAFLLGALVLEVSVYVSSNFLVGRPRPPVEQLEEIVTDSYPSGHMAAATALYLGLVIIVFWHTTNSLARAGIVALAVIAPTVVAVSRLYLGVHYLSDLIAGLLLGLTSIVVALNIARRGLEQEVVSSPEVEPPHAAELDVADISRPAAG